MTTVRWDTELTLFTQHEQDGLWNVIQNGKYSIFIESNI